MDDLSNTILDYYWKHWDELPTDKQFHFASRLYLWHQDPIAAQKLNQLKPYFTAKNNPLDALDTVVSTSLASPTYGSKNAAELRRPYFEKYPQLKGYVGALFRITFLLNVYGLDIREAFFEHFSRSEVKRFAHALISDPEAIAILSTHAANFLYLYSRILLQDDKLYKPDYFLEIGARQYDHDNPLHLQLLIYLYTHCIIGESAFYYRQIKDPRTYLEMIHQLEIIIAEHFDDINLDNKFEFLVCARQLGYQSNLRQLIYDEADHSLSSDGTFLVDRHNHNPQVANIGLDTSEHRNVLFIMANQPYRPLG